MRDANVPVAAIAAALGRHRSTIHHEIRRNFYHDSFRDRWGQKYRGYYCTTADAYARKRRARRARWAKLALRPELSDHVIAKLRAGWSPQQIAGRLRRDPLPCGTVSHETIDRFIHGPDGRGLDLHALLAVARRRRAPSSSISSATVPSTCRPTAKPARWRHGSKRTLASRLSPVTGPAHTPMAFARVHRMRFRWPTTGISCAISAMR